MLLLLDIHLGWTGRCEVVIPSFDQLCIEYERSEDRLALLSMEGRGSKLAQKLESLVTISGTCMMPQFIENRGGDDDNKGENGFDNSNSSSSDDDQKDQELQDSPLKLLLNKEGCGSSPLFLAVRRKKIVAIVEGANYPALEKIVKEHIPSLTDEVEEPVT